MANNAREVSRLLANKFQRKQDRISALPGMLGDGFGHVNVSGRTNYVYVRVAATIAEVFNNRVPAENDLLVMVGYDPMQPDLFQVLSTRTSAPGGSTGGAVTGYAPAIRYQWMAAGGGQDPLWVEKRAFVPRRIGALTGMYLQVYRDIIWTGTAWAAVNTQNFSLAAHIPATEGNAAFVLVTIDTSGAIIRTKGTEVSVADLGLDDIPAVPADTREVLGAVRVYYGQTAIQESRTNTDIVDLRLSGWSAAGGAALTVEEADGTPTVANVDTIIVTNGTLTDNSDGSVTLDFGSAATDAAAIHDDTAGEINAITEKAAPVDADLLLIEDSEDSNSKKKVQIGNLPASGGYTEGARAYNNAAITVANNTSTNITLNTEDWDTDGLHSTSTNTERMTCQTAGKYLVIAQADFQADQDGFRALRIFKGAVMVAYQTTQNHGSSVAVHISVSVIVNLSVGDYVLMNVYHNAGNNLDVLYSAGLGPSLTIQRIG